MKSKFILNLITLFMLSFMITGLSTAPAIPNGAGVQKYNPGLGWNDDIFLIGDFFHAIFDDGNHYLKTGTWVTVTFGVTTGAIALDVPVENSLQDIAEFVADGTWLIVFDGYDITDALISSGHYDSYLQFFYDDENGNPVQEVVVRWTYYIIPQAKGCYNYYGGVWGEGYLFERSSMICWLPPSLL